MSDNPLSPIQRLTPEDRLIAFERRSNAIYTKFSPKSGQSDDIRFGSEQPFVWTSISDSATERNLTKYDTQAIPLGSTVRDVKRIGKFLTSGTGILYLGKQSLLQKENAFNETRRYNPLSVIAATAAKGSTGLIERPKRFLETTGTPGDMVAGALLSLVGIESKTATNAVPNGAASGKVISNQASITSGANKGLIRFQTGVDASDRFNVAWAASSTQRRGGLLERLGNSLVRRLKNTILNTVPFLDRFGGDAQTERWSIRPEYPISERGAGPYESMRMDATGLLSPKLVRIQAPPPSRSGFFGDLFGGIRSRLEDTVFGVAPINRNLQPGDGTIPIRQIHRYFPGATDPIGDQTNWYTKTKFGRQIDERAIGADPTGVQAQKNIRIYQEAELNNVANAARIFSVSNVNPLSTERYIKVNGIDQTKDYPSIPGRGVTPARDSEKFIGKLRDDLTLDARWFSKAARKTPGPNGIVWHQSEPGRGDLYNSLNLIRGQGRKQNGDAPASLMLGAKESKDIIFFYFYDLINDVYIPFRATISGLNDLHSPEWEEVSYIGRADKLYVYKGFTRDVNFNFTVYASSLDELIPMWKRINYLVGLARPSNYTSVPRRSANIVPLTGTQVTNPVGLSNPIGLSDSNAFSVPSTSTTSNLPQFNSTLGTDYLPSTRPIATPPSTFLNEPERGSENTSQFIVPPMVTFRIGDKYVDQPCILKSIGVNIPDDALWETQRGDEYTYLQGVATLNRGAAGKLKQLPTKVDITINMNIMEKKRSITNDDHFGIGLYDQ
jgi:hypothetical protein